MGRAAVVSDRESGWICGTGSMILRPGALIFCNYLQRLLSSPQVVGALTAASVGSTMVNLNQSVLLGIELPLPSIAEQKRIADKLDTLLARIDACRGRLADVGPLVKQFRQAVLAAAISGRLTEEWHQSRNAPDWRVCPIKDAGKIQLGR